MFASSWLFSQMTPRKFRFKHSWCHHDLHSFKLILETEAWQTAFNTLQRPVLNNPRAPFVHSPLSLSFDIPMWVADVQNLDLDQFMNICLIETAASTRRKVGHQSCLSDDWRPLGGQKISVRLESHESGLNLSFYMLCIISAQQAACPQIQQFAKITLGLIPKEVCD